MTERVLILGAGSDIAQATARCFAAEGAHLCLVGRQAEALNRSAADLEARGAGAVITHEADLRQVDGDILCSWREELGGLDTMLLAYASMPEQDELESDPQAQADLFNTNFVSAAGWLQLAAADMAGKGGGCLGVITSVAGDRPRKPNYIYGTSKAALAFFAEGLALRMNPAGVHVCIIKPGQTRTRLTEHMDTQGALWSDAAEVGLGIHRALARRQRVTYVPGRWRWIMMIIKAIPHLIFKRLNI